MHVPCAIKTTIYLSQFLNVLNATFASNLSQLYIADAFHIRTLGLSIKNTPQGTKNGHMHTAQVTLPRFMHCEMH